MKVLSARNLMSEKLCSAMSLQLERKVAAFPPPSEQSKKYIQNFLVDIHSLITGKKIKELVYNNI